MRAVQICCGAGGSTLGFERAGIENVYAFDFDPVMVEIHQVNFPKVPCVVKDIREMAAGDLPEADIWLCGIPCEPFSCAGLELGHADRRDISFEVVRLLRGIQGEWPRYVVLENVPPFEHTPAAAAIRTALIDARFCHGIEAVFLYADYGVCQMRRRWHIIAARQGPTPVPTPTHSELPDLFRRLPWIRFGEIRDQGATGYASARALKGVFRRVIRYAVLYGDAYSPQVVGDDDLLPTVMSVWRAHINGTTPLIYSDGRLRPPTLLEAQRAQGFPDDFQVTRTQVEQWKAIGQAIAPPFAEAVGRAILSSDKESTRNNNGSYGEE